MPYSSNYQATLSLKIEALKKCLIEDPPLSHSHDLSLEALRTPEGINKLYEAYTILFDKRIGIETRVGQTSWGPVFIRHQHNDTHRELDSDSLAYRSEHYKVKALHSLKITNDYIQLFIKDKIERSKLYKQAHQLFIDFEALFDDLDGSSHIHRCLNQFNHAIHLLFDQTFHGSQFEQYFQKLNAWSQIDLSPHDIITIDIEDNTFEIIINASAPTEKLFLEMAIINFHKEYDYYPDETSLFRYLLKKNKCSGLNQNDIKNFFEDKKNNIMSWYVNLSQKDKSVIQHYADSFLNDFIVSPVRLTEFSAGNNTDPFPAPLRNCYVNINGWLDKTTEHTKVRVSGIHLRSAAASRTGHIHTTLGNTKLLLSAIDGISENAKLSSAALLTDAITTVSKLRYLVGKTAEPDTKILDAHQHTSTILSSRMKLRISSIIMKMLSDYYGRQVQHDPFNMMEKFQSISFEKQNTIPNPIDAKPYAIQLHNAYKAVNTFVKRYYQITTKDAFDSFIQFFQKDHQRTEETLRYLKKYYADTKDISLLEHVRFLEAIYTYTILHLNHLKKCLFGTDTSPVVETVLEHASPVGDHKLAHQHYHQWLLALESIIGYHFPLLNHFIPEEKHPFSQHITHYYCKDGRDRTSLIATLIKALHKMFDAQVSTLANKKDRTAFIDIEPLCMIPITNLKRTTPLFKQTHDRVIDDFSSALLCGSPQSAMGDYGLLSKLFGSGYGIVASSVPPIRAGLKRITLPVANEFSKPYAHSHSIWTSLFTEKNKHGSTTSEGGLIEKYLHQI